MLLSNRKLFVAGSLTVLLACMAVGGQNRAGGPIEFSLRSVDGQTVTSQSLRGEAVVMAFGASWLPLSRTQLQGVRKFADESFLFPNQFFNGFNRILRGRQPLSIGG